jgi:hypothetical protein
MTMIRSRSARRTSRRKWNTVGMENMGIHDRSANGRDAWNALHNTPTQSNTI